MIRRTLAQIAAMIGGTAVPDADPDQLIAGVSKDTRAIQPGSLYVPLVGEHFDGHDFVQDAIDKGAAASLWQEGHGQAPAGLPIILVDDSLAALQRLAKAYRSELNTKIIGVTGSNGKTTTKDMLAAVLSTTYRVHKTMGNLNNHIGLPLTLLQLEEDTEVAVLEMGMSGRKEIELLSDIAQPDAAIITNIGEAHLLQLGSREEIARAKTEILHGLKPGGLFVYLGDEPLIEQAVQEMGLSTPPEKVRFGTSEDNDIYPVSIQAEVEGTRFAVNACPGVDFYIPLLGKHNVINALAVIGLAQRLGVTAERMAQGLESLQLTSMRIELIKADSGLTILNDAYNASPTSMRAALQLLHELQGYGRKYAVLGDMLELGPREAEFHRSMGALLDPGEVETVFVFGPLSKHIAEEASKKFHPEKVKAFDDKNELVTALARIVRPEDVVLVKGSRGMKLEQVVTGLQGGSHRGV
ncbi:UDP-N-acetylmuramoyl-tripeptide--D-alanyl-D-alanine ligase [Paenibacillus thalictri]|uniref:UDP-N-acetylmuramoyl-tripeptide--D-alanyl-D-alanine ligase n=1 Tax=Paenibacillus thalictri TaxID=2527873 RepID=A0A4Q9DQT5_9BACL|nr:UDP-N-acetylmuramoyl-tripeptide--D-alanyl-D-alanine ligase [Paenibacillus thalictri]TBL78152.1 UDP-N-acetylmuramoyl-tripeptide--D-alanyl-D-alanine ligase [Paenibacillus thalictri]